jgi:hypothetical protein
MIPVIGVVVVLGCIAGGYLIEKGNLLVLMQPAELLIIGGAALGTVLIGNPIYVLKAIVAGVLQVFKGSRYTASIYLDTLKFLNDFFNTARKNGLAALEQDLDEPDKSELFKRHPNFYKDKEAVHFLCDSMRTHLTGGVDSRHCGIQYGSWRPTVCRGVAFRVHLESRSPFDTGSSDGRESQAAVSYRATEGRSETPRDLRGGRGGTADRMRLPLRADEKTFGGRIPCSGSASSS